ncbi:heterokaryon incompatibility protein-domain-containing protein [Penicillium tannophilum]|nr:heterokaryon incompatibility protein-domain-containing protein [Penicillium tannophilum]
MHGYGRFAALSNLQEENEREENEDGNDVEEVDSSCEEYSTALLPIESWDVTSELSLGFGHSEMTTRNLTWCAKTVKACSRQRGRKGRAVSAWTRRTPQAVARVMRSSIFWAPESLNDLYIDLEYWFVPREGYFMGVLDVIFTLTRQLAGELRTARFGFQMFKDKERHFIPSRLIEITRDGAGKISIRLRGRDDISHDIKYATLSYCWGSFMPLKLEDSKISQYRERIPMEEISPVFRDALDVSVALDIWYIWIDSLFKPAEVLPTVT